jgi:U3 small nucleolar RNA-associated protein 11
MSGESAMKNAIPRRAHRERSQPAKRKKFGLLEKHKDYIERATDYKKKQKTLKTLKRRASERNPDEFYFKMNKSQVKDGMHTNLVRENVLDPATVLLLKTQDLGYIIHKKSIDDHKIDKLKANLHFIGQTGTSSKFHLRFNEDSIVSTPVTEGISPQASSGSGTRSLLPTSLSEEDEPIFDAKSRSKLQKKQAAVQKKRVEARVERHIETSYRELNRRVKRSQQLGTALKELMLQRHLMGKGSKRKLIPATELETEMTEEESESTVKSGAVYKWKRERLR